MPASFRDWKRDRYLIPFCQQEGILWQLVLYHIGNIPCASASVWLMAKYHYGLLRWDTEAPTVGVKGWTFASIAFSLPPLLLLFGNFSAIALFRNVTTVSRIVVRLKRCWDSLQIPVGLCTAHCHVCTAWVYSAPPDLIYALSDGSSLIDTYNVWYCMPNNE